MLGMRRPVIAPAATCSPPSAWELPQAQAATSQPAPSQAPARGASTSAAQPQSGCLRTLCGICTATALPCCPPAALQPRAPRGTRWPAMQWWATLWGGAGLQGWACPLRPSPLLWPSACRAAQSGPPACAQLAGLCMAGGGRRPCVRHSLCASMVVCIKAAGRAWTRCLCSLEQCQVQEMGTGLGHIVHSVYSVQLQNMADG